MDLSGDFVHKITCIYIYIYVINKMYERFPGPRDYLPCGSGHPAVQPNRPHSARHGGNVTGKHLQLCDTFCTK